METKNFAATINCGSEKLVSNATDRENLMIGPILNAFVKQTKAAINFNQIEPKLLHLIMNMRLDETDKLRPILIQYSKSKKVKDISSIIKDSSVDYKGSMGLGTKFWRSLFGEMLKNSEHV